MISPIKITGKIIGGENWSLVCVGRQPHTSQTQNLIPELRRREIREPRNAVCRRRVQALMAASAAHVSLEHLEPVIVLLLGSVRLPEPALEVQKVVLCSQPDAAALHHLHDQRLIVAAVRRRREEDGENNKEEDYKSWIVHVDVEKLSVESVELGWFFYNLTVRLRIRITERAIA